VQLLQLVACHAVSAGHGWGSCGLLIRCAAGVPVLGCSCCLSSLRMIPIPTAGAGLVPVLALLPFVKFYYR
jgi:hypothetical protein